MESIIVTLYSVTVTVAYERTDQAWWDHYTGAMESGSGDPDNTFYLGR